MKSFSGGNQLSLRPLLIIGLFLLIAGLAFVASQRQLMLVLLLPLGVGSVLMFVRWPPLGLLVAALAGMMVPFLGPSGLNVTMMLVALLLGLWLLDIAIGQRQIQFAAASPAVLPPTTATKSRPALLIPSGQRCLHSYCEN